MKKNTHFALIPARKNSTGFPKKNRKFFDNTANFINNIGWFDQVLVSSDDEKVLEKAKQNGYSTHKRNPEFAKPNISIKDTLRNVIEENNIQKDVYIWLFYLPILYKNKLDFEKAFDLIESGDIDSLCSFVPANTHPYNCWRFDKSNSKIIQYISNDIYRRQDLPDAWMHYHYLCIFKARSICELNNELLCESTLPIFLNQDVCDKLVEIDTHADYEKWKLLNSK